MTRAAVTLAAAAFAALAPAVPASADLRLSSAREARFPDRAYVLTLPPGERLSASEVHVTENGRGVQAPALVPATSRDGDKFGVVLVIDTSASMRGAPVKAAFAAAREFAKHRAPGQKVAIVTFNSTEPVTLLAPTTDAAAIDAALSRPPETSGGTRAYDAVDSALAVLRDAQISAGSVILLSDGADNGSATSREEVAARARAEGTRIYSVGLRSRHFRSGALAALARDAQGDYAEAGSADELRAIYSQLAARLASEYLLSYRSVEAPARRVSVEVTVDGVGSATATYTTPALPKVPQAAPRGGAWTSGVMLVVISIGCAALFGLVIVALLALVSRRRRVEGQMAAFLAAPELEGPAEGRASDRAGVLADGADRRLNRMRWWPAFKENVDLADIQTPAIKIAAMTGGASLVCLLLFGAAIAPVAGILAAAIPPAVAHVVVKVKVGKRRRAFAEQLADNLQVIASAMRAGNSFVGALSVAVQDAAEPAKRELQRAVTDERLGVQFDEALGKVQRRMDNKDLSQVILVAALQRETGGNTAEILDRVAETIRERMELRRFVRVLTAQGRLARGVVTALPIGLALILQALSPNYLDPLFHTTTGIVMCFVALTLLVTAWFVINRIIDIKV